jgi:hypothetical protein
MHELTLPYSPEYTRNAEHFNQVINTIARSLTIAAPNLASLWVTGSNIAV